MKPATLLFISLSLTSLLVSCSPSGAGNAQSSSTEVSTTEPALPLEEQERQIARTILGRILEAEGELQDWDFRILRADLQPMVDQLHLLRQKGLESRKPVYEDAFYSTADLAQLEELELRIQKNPKLGLEIENLLRTYSLLDCETLDAALRSWLVAQNH